MKSKKNRQLRDDADYSATNSALIAILAAVLEPQALKDNPGPAIRRAEQIIRAVPKYLADKGLQAKFEGFNLDLEQGIKEAKKWGFADLLGLKRKLYQAPDQLPEGAMKFKEAVDNGTCENYKTVHGLTRLLKSVGYPPRYLQMEIITEHGYQEALKEQKQKRREKDSERHRESRKNKSSSSKSSADKSSRS
jgi:hypothetical protein